MCQPQKCNARFQRLAIRLNHGLSRITRITRILRSPKQLSRHRGSFGFKGTAFGHGDPNEQRGSVGHGDPNEQRGSVGHGDPNEHRTRGPERTSDTGTRTNKGCFDLGIEGFWDQGFFGPLSLTEITQYLILHDGRQIVKPFSLSEPGFIGVEGGSSSMRKVCRKYPLSVKICWIAA